MNLAPTDRTALLKRHNSRLRPTSSSFIITAAVLLAFTALAKIWSGFGSSDFLEVTDPILGIKFGHLMFVVGILEIVVSAICILTKQQTLALGSIAWLSASFVTYRMGLWLMNWRRPCNCLGNLTDALHISAQTADNLMKVVLAYLLIGSYGLLFWQWNESRRFNAGKLEEA